MSKKRVVIIILAVVLGLLAVDGALRLIGVMSAVSTGLTIHTTPNDAVVNAPGTVSFDYSILSPLTCTAQCTAKLIRHDTLEMIAQTELGVLASSTISASIEDEDSLKQVPVQLIVTCSTQQTRYCAHNEQVSVDLAMVRFDLNEDEQALREAIIEVKSYIEEEIAQNRALLEALITLEAPYTAIAAQALSDQQVYETETASFLEGLAQEQYTMPPQRPDAVSAWYSEQSLEPFANTESERIAERMSALRAYRTAIGTDQSTVEELIEAYTKVEAAPSDALSFFANATSVLDRIENLSSERIITASLTSARRTFDDLTAACTIHGSLCPEPFEARTLDEAYALSERMCALAANTTDTRAALAAQLNLTLEEALEAYNATAIRERAEFERFETSANENASRGFMNLTMAERFAIIVPIRSAHCRDAIEPVRFVVPTLELEPEPIELTILSERTCSLGACDTGLAAPILFVHGHSFAEGSDPRSNLQGLTRLALAFEAYGYLYAGHLFPTTTRRIGTIDAPASFTATYYVNSYEEDGTIRMDTFKSEPIESYALRLREDIEEARRLTGSDTVIIVAHSMGGLVARSYLDLFGSDHVERLIMIGTPNSGIVDRIERICPLIGANLECRDMTRGSVFLRRLNAQPLPDIPMHIIAGTGCDEGDGIVQLENAMLTGVNTTVITGACTGFETLHSALIDPREELGTVEIIARELGR